MIKKSRPDRRHRGLRLRVVMERAALRDHVTFLQKHLIKGLTAGAMKG